MESRLSGYVPKYILQFAPDMDALPFPPAPAPRSIMRPISFSSDFYLSSMEPRVVLTACVAYTITATSLNVYNISRRGKAQSAKSSRVFDGAVILHNILLAVYSAWTFCGMIGVMRRSMISPSGPGGLQATVESLCRMHGREEMLSSVLFNPADADWKNSQKQALAAGFAAQGTRGHIWNEGLSYYGWLFYLSKIYEVVDTFIVLAKGKVASTLQIYHHAGAILSLWAGIRFMSPPIWLFVTINSFIHAVMYTYYTLKALAIHVPGVLKQLLTTMQIIQLFTGITYASAHLFVSFRVPVPELSNSKGSAVQDGETIGYVTQPCLSTYNQAFAIGLNVAYLLPLTWLFIAFYVKSYFKRRQGGQSAKKGKVA